MSDTNFQAVAIERWTWSHRMGVCAWLAECFGDRNTETWDIDRDYDLETLIMRADIFSLYLLKFES